MSVKIKDFPKDICIRIDEDGKDKYLSADIDADAAENGELVAIYSRKEIRRKKLKTIVELRFVSK